MSAPQIDTIDCGYLDDEFAAAYLRTETDASGQTVAQFIETNTAHAVPRLLAALAARGLQPEQVEAVIVTHVHLDHAGGASALMEACPNAVLLAHPRAARHLIDPSKLIASATQVYGAERFRELYGEIRPIPAERVRTIEDGERWTSRAGSTLEFIHVRGHANHHFVVHDPASRSVFTGDAFGLAYPPLQRAGTFVIPSTSPTDFDAEAARQSVRRIAGLPVERAYLTHFGAVTRFSEAASQLIGHLDFSEQLLGELRSGMTEAEAAAKLRAHYDSTARAIGLQLAEADWKILSLDIELNAQGLAFAARKAA